MNKPRSGLLKLNALHAPLPPLSHMHDTSLPSGQSGDDTRPRSRRGKSPL